MRLKRFVSLLAGIGAVIASLLLAEPGQAQEPGSPVVATFRGSHSNAETHAPAEVGPVHLHAGIVIVRARHTGTNTNFVVSLELPEPGRPLAQGSRDSYLLINSAGHYEGAAATVVRAEGDYLIKLTAGGAYELIVEQPSPSTVAPVEGRRYERRNQNLTPIVALPAGPRTITVETDAPGMIAWLYLIDDLGGAAVGPDYDGRFIDTGRGSGLRVTVDFPTAGLYFAAFQPLDAPSATWTVTLE